MSDSPSTQYSNKKMFYLMTQHLPKKFEQIQNITYNFSEIGHGKGPADGIGAALKRTLDDAVKYKKDLPNFNEVLSVLKEMEKSMYVSSVSLDDIESVDRVLPEAVKSFVGKMQVHQYTWDQDTSTNICFNTLSCFDCPSGKLCEHYN